jgi:CHAT domain-containing protein
MLRDGPFTLRDIMTTRLQAGCAGLAFLSACQSAAPSSSVPNEVLHLCAGLQFTGFASVVGTQWSVMDDIAAEVAQVFYEELFRGENKARLTYSAEALHASLMLLKERGRPVEHLMPFIHVGI